MRLIIATNLSVTGVAEKNALTAFLEAKGWPVWHWYDDLWLIDNVPDQLNLKALREEIQQTIPAIRHILVLAATGTTAHSGMVPKGSADWFTEHWSQR